MRRLVWAKAVAAERQKARARAVRRRIGVMAASFARRVPVVPPLCRRGVDPIEIAIVVGVFGRAELALHDHATAGIAHVAELLTLDRAQHAVDALAAAATARHERPTLELARPLLVEQAV